jgi:hypothetical protein
MDIETSVWEMDADALTACDRLEARVFDNQTWLVRIGYPFLYRMGGPSRNNLGFSHILLAVKPNLARRYAGP